MHTFIHSFNTPMPAHARLCWAQGLKLECCIGPELQPVGKKCSGKTTAPQRAESLGGQGSG